MASSIRLCAVKKCEISSCAVCHCCQKNLCLDHLKEHRDQLNAKLLPFANQINTFIDDLEHFTPTSLPSFKKLEQWRVAAHETVDQFYERMRGELFEEKKNKPLEKLRVTRDDLDQLIRKQGATHENINLLNDRIRLIEQEINELQNIQINLNPLVIHANAINLSNSSGRSDQPIAGSNKKQNTVLTDNDFQIFIQLSNGQHTLVTVKPSDTIMEVKNKIHEKQNIPIEDQHLTYVGKRLIDNYSIATYGIQKQSTINLFINPKKVQNVESTS